MWPPQNLGHAGEMDLKIGEMIEVVEVFSLRPLPASSSHSMRAMPAG